MTGVGDLSIVIPTYGRDQVLVDTLRLVQEITPAAAELIVVDQTANHSEGVGATLAEWHRSGAIRWLRIATPSIPRAMNQGLLAATRPVVLFLDDDVVPDAHLVAEHLLAHQRHPESLIVGRVLQPWDDATSLSSPFASSVAGERREFIGCNFSISRNLALAIGGMDENFVGAAYRFEADVARRLLATGRRIHFWPAAAIRHLKIAAGGTRSRGGHEGGFRPQHGVGEYYHLLRSHGAMRALPPVFARLVRSAITRRHLRRPWEVPLSVGGELVAIAWAASLALRGPRLLACTSGASGP
jgi:GT2 family glycosyltransferase